MSAIAGSGKYLLVASISTFDPERKRSFLLCNAGLMAFGSAVQLWFGSPVERRHFLFLKSRKKRLFSATPASNPTKDRCGCRDSLFPICNTP
jgi:hypothetical protein